MDEDKLKTIVKEVVEEAIEPINQRLGNIEGQLDNPNTGLAAINRRLDDPESGLKAIKKKVDVLWEQTESLTEDMAEVQETLESHTKILNSHSKALKQIATYTEQNGDNVSKLNKRVMTIEKHSGIVPPPELTFP